MPEKHLTHYDLRSNTHIHTHTFIDIHECKKLKKKLMGANLLTNG